MDNDTIISGLAALHLTVVANFDGGQVFIEMQDSETGLRLGHATMNKDIMQGYSPQTVTPGETVVMMMEFSCRCDFTCWSRISFYD